LGGNPRFRALYEISNGAKPGFGVEIDMYEFGFDVYDKDIRDNTISFSNNKASIFLTSVYNNLYSLKTGVEYEFFKFSQNTAKPDSNLIPLENYNSYGNVFIKFRADTRNKSYFATNGFKAEFKAVYVMPLSKGWASELFENSFLLYAKYNQNLSLTPKLTFKPGFFVGATLNDRAAPIQHLFGVGGLNSINYIDSFVPFAGVNFVQRFGYYAAIARLKLQYNVYEKLYLTLRSDFGSTPDYVDEIISPINVIAGYGLTASYDSFIGPVEFTVMGSNINPSLSLYLNIGFNF